MIRDRTTEQLYRGIVIHWYRIVPEAGRTTYAATWEIAGAWYQTEGADLIVAIDAAEAQIDTQLASAQRESPCT